MEIVPVTSGANLGHVRALLQEYWTSFGFTPCFQGFSAELAGLPGAYSPPRGRLGLAMKDGQPAGCVALCPLEGSFCEARRLFVRHEFRGCGIGRALLEWIIAEARAAGYRELRGHTLQVMDRALAMYARHGFERLSPPPPDLPPDAIPLRLRL